MNASAILSPGLLLDFRLGLFHLLFLGTDLLLCSLHLLAGFLRLRAGLAVLFGLIVKAIAILLLLLFERAKLIVQPVLVLLPVPLLILNSILVLCGLLS